VDCNGKCYFLQQITTIFIVDFKIYKFLDLNCLMESVMAAALLDSI